MYETEPYIQRPDDFHQCFEYVTHNTRCTQTAIQGEYFCPDHRIKPMPIIIYPDGGFHLPPLTDRDSIVRVASQIAQRVANKSLDQKRAGKILYACQIANQALEGKLRDQKLALQQAKHAASSQLIDPQPSQPQTLSKCHPEAKPKDLSISPATEPKPAPTQPEPPHSEPQAQNLRISPATETPASAPNLTECHPEAKPKDLSISPPTEPRPAPQIDHAPPPENLSISAGATSPSPRPNKLPNPLAQRRTPERPVQRQAEASRACVDRYETMHLPRSFARNDAFISQCSGNDSWVVR